MELFGLDGQSFGFGDGKPPDGKDDTVFHALAPLSDTVEALI
jgi:hypothetical protein